MASAEALYTGRAMRRSRPIAGPAMPAGGLLRVGALLAGGSLLAGSSVLLATAWSMANPPQQLVAALVTAVIGVAVCLTALLPPERKRARLVLFSAAVFSIVTLALVRYIPPLYTFAYEQDLEALFPPLWPYSIAVPLLIGLIGEMALHGRGETLSLRGPMLLSITAACICFFFSSALAGELAAGPHLTVPEKSLVSFGACIGISSLIILGWLAARKGFMWASVGLLLSIGLALEIASTYFYEGIPTSLSHTFHPLPLSVWVPLLGGTVPGAVCLLAALLLFRSVFLDSEHDNEEFGESSPLYDVGTE